MSPDRSTGLSGFLAFMHIVTFWDKQSYLSLVPGSASSYTEYECIP